MAKKKSKKKKKDSKKSKSKKSVAHHVHKHLTREVSLSVGVVIILVILVLVKVPYQAVESYTETEPYEVEISEVVEDTDNPVEERVCKSEVAEVRVEPDPLSPYIDSVGLSGFNCVASFRVWNQEESGGKWTYQYVFDVSGKEVVTDPQTKFIEKSAAVTFKFESEECQQGDTLTGRYELVESPTVEQCNYVTVYPNITVSRTETKYKEVEKERTITKYEPLWQKLVGYNKHEKV